MLPALSCIFPSEKRPAFPSPVSQLGFRRLRTDWNTFLLSAVCCWSLFPISCWPLGFTCRRPLMNRFYFEGLNTQEPQRRPLAPASPSPRVDRGGDRSPSHPGGETPRVSLRCSDLRSAMSPFSEGRAILCAETVSSPPSEQGCWGLGAIGHAGRGPALLFPPEPFCGWAVARAQVPRPPVSTAGVPPPAPTSCPCKDNKDGGAVRKQGGNWN